MEEDVSQSPSLHTLPVELVDAVVDYLSASEVARLSSTCVRFASLLNKNSARWINFIKDSLPYPLSALPHDVSAKHFYSSLHPYWFLPSYRLWFSDATLYGKLVLVRYDQRRSCIEGYTVAARRGDAQTGSLDWDGSQVFYTTFNPHVSLDLNKPALRLDARPPDTPFEFLNETVMNIDESHGVKSTFLPAQSLPEEVANHRSTRVWPPSNLHSPGNQRVRAESSNAFRSKDHSPKYASAVSTAAFRIREWLEFAHLPLIPVNIFGRRQRAEVASTYGTMSPESYRPTPDKPFQGVWCGDYGPHGCEFLAILQPDHPQPLPKRARAAFEQWPTIDSEDVQTLLYGEDDEEFGLNGDDFRHITQLANPDSDSQSMTSASASDEDWTFLGSRQGSPHVPSPYRGRLEAVKLTGDPNMPRGEYSFIAHDLGDAGLLGFRHDDIFVQAMGSNQAQDGRANDAAGELPRGARVVRSVGHVAGRGFVRDTYIPTQLVLVSHDVLAQYWMPFRQVSFYKRVDVDALTWADVSAA